MTRTAVVVGARGVIGSKLIEHLVGGGWDVIGLSRRGGPDGPGIRHLAVDLLDSDQPRAAAAAELSRATHVFYAAYQDRPRWSELVAPNVAMLQRVLGMVRQAPIEHVSLMQGYKVYGAHLGPFKTPARESDPPHLPPEFNVDQQDLLTQTAAERGFGWSAIRPSVVAGTTLGNPMNLAMVIGVFASLSRELDVPLRFPGAPGAYGSLLEMTDADLLAKATIWAATDPAATNEAFNIANGDLFRWSELWPLIAQMFGIDVAPPLPMSLSEVMADKEPLWERLRARDALVATYSDVSSWGFGDFVFSWDYDMFADTSKARRFGFHRSVDTVAMFERTFRDLQEQRVLPRPR